MKKLFEFILSGCWHHWVTEKTLNLRDPEEPSKMAAGIAYICVCSKCGTPKRFDLY